MKSIIYTTVSVSLLVLAFGIQLSAQNTIAGTVKDPNGDLIAGASVTVRNKQTSIGKTTMTGRDGSFSFSSLQTGEYNLRVLANGFAAAEQTVQVSGGSMTGISITLSIGENRLTVTAEVGQAEEARNVAQAVSVIGTEAISERATSVLAQVGEEEAGLNTQRTSPTIGAVVVRGMTGKNVANFVDGVRFTNGAQRGGINT
ncbi:MAG: DUF2012 domain-containing protein, partial [Pyrinomonadaceae bacterium]